MKYLILLFYCLLCLKASGQIRVRSSLIDSMLTPLERDSFKRGITPFALKEIYGMERQKYFQTLDSMLRTYEGKPIPNFEARDTLGILHRPSHYYGRVLVLHFWNFWEYSFKNEIPHLNTLVEKYRKDGVEILSFVDLTLTKSEKEILEKTPVLFPIIENAYKFGANFLPTYLTKPSLIFVDKSGKMRYIMTGEKLNVIQSNVNEMVEKNPKTLKIDALEEKIMQLLKE
jgi:thiol-disulfide isomerase/thioredoxin